MNKIVVTLFVVLVLVGCGTSHVEPNFIEQEYEVETAVSTQPATPTNEPTSQPTHTPTVTNEPTATLMPTEEPTATAEPTPNIQQTRAARMPATIPQDSVAFSSNAMAENTGVLINFQHPHAWQTSYFSDSGSSGWLISDADPNEAFWSALSTGEESMILILPVYDIADLRELPAESEPILIETNSEMI